MSSAGSGLRELHELLKKLYECRQQIESGPKRIAVQQKVAKRRQADIDALKEEMKVQQKATDAINLAIKTSESKINDLKSKLNQASSNKEFDIFKGQIAAAQEATDALDEQYLEALEAIDAQKLQLKELQADMKAAEEDVEKRRTEIAIEEPKLKERLAELEAEVKAAQERLLPASIMDHYRRLLHAHGADALTTVMAECCNACSMGLSPQNMVQLRTGQHLICKECGRVMYYEAADN